MLNLKRPENIRATALQCLLIFFALLALLFVAQLVQNDLLTASLGASSFLAFTAPHKHSAREGVLIGSYFIAALIGVGTHYLMPLLAPLNLAPALYYALAVALTSVIMVVTSLAHPPAAALAISVASHHSPVLQAAVAVLSISVIVVIKLVFRKRLVDLY